VSHLIPKTETEELVSSWQMRDKEEASLIVAVEHAGSSEIRRTPYMSRTFGFSKDRVQMKTSHPVRYGWFERLFFYTDYFRTKLFETVPISPYTLLAFIRLFWFYGL
jgi:hypothetical protein